MRIRRNPIARPELAASKIFIDEPILNKGHWHELFLKKQPIYLELGCGKGTFIAKMSSSMPNTNFIAVDIKSEVLFLAKRNVEQTFKELNKNIENVYLTAYNIELINNIFDENDKVNRIYINFCNPWPRPKHKKRRLTHPRQLNHYKKFLIPSGEIFFKTDDDELFNESINYFEDNGFNIIYKTYDLHASNFEENIETEHEKMFIEQGKKIKFLIARIQ